jgi:hypothetical protein
MYTPRSVGAGAPTSSEPVEPSAALAAFGVRDPVPRKRAWRYIHRLVTRPSRFEHHRYVGDKRSQTVYDLDLADGDPDVAARIDELLASEQFVCFGPDTLAEARNRCYRPHRSIVEATRDTDED